jgi:hypothetical protein
MTIPPGGYPGQPQDPQRPGSEGSFPFLPPGGHPSPGAPPGTPGYQQQGPPPAPQAQPPYSQPPLPQPQPPQQPQYGQYGQPLGQPPQGQQQYGPGGPPAPGWPAAPPTRNRTPLIIALVAVLAVVLSAVAWGVSRGGDDPSTQAEKFMTSVQNSNFSDSKGLICKDGRDKFSTAAELSEALVDGGTVTGFTIGTVTDDTFQGDKRKVVQVSVQMEDGTTKQVTLSMTKESGKYLVCGF